MQVRTHKYHVPTHTNTYVPIGNKKPNNSGALRHPLHMRGGPEVISCDDGDGGGRGCTLREEHVRNLDDINGASVSCKLGGAVFV